MLLTLPYCLSQWFKVKNELLSDLSGIERAKVHAAFSSTSIRCNLVSYAMALDLCSVSSNILFEEATGPVPFDCCFFATRHFKVLLVLPGICYVQVVVV